MLWIGNTDQTLTLVKAPYSMTVLNQDIDAATTTRSASGIMTRDVVRNGENNVRKIELEWRGLDLEEGASILQAVMTQFVFVKYMDAQTGQLRTGEFYVGDRSSSMWRYGQGGKDVKWESIKFNLIER